MDYPLWDIAFGGSLLIAVVAITHVIVSHFAIGGGLVIAVTETLAVKRGDDEMRELARRSSKLLILVSTVFGAISGVGIWVVVGLISPGAIAALIRNYVWGWAIEWVFFIVELAAALIYWNTWDKVKKNVHVAIGWIYFVAAYLSLVIINGIVTFMLTPGRWLETRAFWDGFFNPTYWPGLVLRTGICLAMATAFMALAARHASDDARPRLMRYLGGFMVVGVLVFYGGYRWWESALPDSVRSLFLGDSPVLLALADTRRFVLWAATVTLVLAALFLVALPKTARLVPLVVLALAAFAFFGGYERLREGTRKPYLIHDYMFSNGLRVEDVGEVNEGGVLAASGWAAHGAGSDPVSRGEAIFKAECRSCHTLDGYQAIRPLLPEDSDMTLSVVYTLWDQGQAYAALEPGQTVDKSKLDYPYMAPFVGTEAEMDDLVAYLATLTQTASLGEGR